MLEQIMDEITDFCSNRCQLNLSCPEEDCVLFRIEKIVESNNGNLSEYLQDLEEECENLSEYNRQLIERIKELEK